ncbi:electron transport complex subunit RsxG [Thiomicrorhabdus sediminis]|uniref:Ion-translocating oxidoreductase complex subunit G n=1 Tax=Thiomicrorhabdus sediminis TaxID=2580412 RepID=A0A4P9K7V6_9GAMM|nr:electron transport complex subunit RsxG [Thiomicrorhabdus sediminis]QCU90327.1 electron transport complex subunit RsxG [Thiomicrorhabdus sediminis]
MSKPNSTTIFYAMSQASGKLVVFILLSISFLLLVHYFSTPIIQQAKQDNLISSFNQVLPSNEYDNDLLADQIQITDPQVLAKLGSDEPINVYRAYKNQQPVALIYTTYANDGYNGKIEILVGLYATGNISGVRVLDHRETPGLGDKIDISKNDWVMGFANKNLHDGTRWAVKKDGGDFDQFTGATITPRAVVKAVYNSLQAMQQLGGELYE